LFDTFFDHFSSMFPFLNRQVVDRQIREGGADAGFKATISGSGQNLRVQGSANVAREFEN
jgi:hypothetical protein